MKRIIFAGLLLVGFAAQADRPNELVNNETSTESVVSAGGTVDVRYLQSTHISKENFVKDCEARNGFTAYGGQGYMCYKASSAF